MKWALAMVVFDFTKDIGFGFSSGVVAYALGICAGGLAINHGFHCSGALLEEPAKDRVAGKMAAPGCVDETSDWSCCSGLE